MCNLSEPQRDLVKSVLTRFVPGCEVRIFGSRYTGKARPYSDLDLAIVGPNPLDWKCIADLKDAFAESDLPFRVDVLDWHAISPEFRAVIEHSGYAVLVTSTDVTS